MRIVASKTLGFLSNFTIFFSDDRLLFCNFAILSLVSEKKATSDPETNAEKTSNKIRMIPPNKYELRNSAISKLGGSSKPVSK